MKIETKFSCRDLAWVPVYFDGCYEPRQGTIGKITVEVTDSPGRDGEEIFDNFKPQKEYAETYMMVESGVGSGSTYNFIFATEEECQSHIDKVREEENARRCY